MRLSVSEADLDGKLLSRMIHYSSNGTLYINRVLFHRRYNPTYILLVLILRYQQDVSNAYDFGSLG